VPCGFDYDDSGDGKRFRTKHGITGPMVLFLGRKTKEKGVERLLNAWPMVAEKFPEATLVFAGPKSTLGALEDIRWKIEDRRGEGRMADGRVAPEDRRSETGDRGGGGGAADNGPVEYASHSTGERGVIADVGKSADFEKLKPEKLKSEMVNSESESSKPPRESQGTSLATSYPLPVTAPAALSRILNLDDLTEGEKQDALAACDLLCVPSEGESFGMVYFEAWAYKKPVVGLDLPVLRETIGAANAGILVEKNPQEIAHGISVLLSDSELRGQFGANGHRLALGHKWEEAAKHYLQGYEEAMKTKTL
jgi:glycosyltransferase involved in cell wall biosynthesis